MSESVATGQCLCKKVRVSFSIKEKVFDACHCGMCRKWTGGPLLAVSGGMSPKFEGTEFISVFNSSEWAERGFCKNCGTHLFYRLKGNNYHSLPLGLLDDSAQYKFHVEIYVDHKPANYSFANQTEKMTEAQVIAKFSGG